MLAVYARKREQAIYPSTSPQLRKKKFLVFLSVTYIIFKIDMFLVCPNNTNVSILLARSGFIIRKQNDSHMKL